MGNFISTKAFRDSFNDWNSETLSFDVVAKLNFFRKIQRHFSIESIRKELLMIARGN
jgi:hypothetical protein